MIDSKKLIIVLVISVLMGCHSKSDSPKEESEPSDYPLLEQNESYNAPISSSFQNGMIQESTENTKETEASIGKIEESVISVSKWYQLGYDRGYDDGEDDALHRNGWQGSFDDTNRLKGKAKEDYELGYEEGYEAGFDDNKADDGSDDEYE